MIDKILSASDGSQDSIQTLKYAELLAKRFKAAILALFVIPDYSEGVFGRFPSDEKKNEFINWIQ
jgi:nucleotide-binding universal stress UspA family protein